MCGLFYHSFSLFRQFIRSQQTYEMFEDRGLWLSSADVGSLGSEGAVVSGENFALMPYYNDDVFSRMSTPGPNGLAIYFYLNPAPYLDGEGDRCASVEPEDNASSDERERCLPPQNFLSPSSSNRHWVITAGIYSLQYGLFGAFILCLNRLHRYHKYRRRKRLSSSTSSREDSELMDEVSILVSPVVVSVCILALLVVGWEPPTFYRG